MSLRDVRIVVDASIAIAWCFEDEATSESEAIADRVRDHGGLAPALWPLEVANVLLLSEKRGRMTAAEASGQIEILSQLPIEIDQETPSRAFREIAALARAEKLTTYDAAYLELALRRGAPLATRDNDLARAGRRAGVEILG